MEKKKKKPLDNGYHLILMKMDSLFSIFIFIKLVLREKKSNNSKILTRNYKIITNKN